MLLQTIRYSKEQGWTDKFPDYDSEQTLILIFAAADYIKESQPIEEIFTHYKKAKIIGCSTAGEICDGAVYDESISVAIIKMEKTELQTCMIEIPAANESFEAGESIAKKLDRDDLQGIFVLAEGLKINGSELVKGLNTLQKKDLTITGGLAGDSDRFKQTWVISDRKILTNNIVAVGFYGSNIHIGHGSKGGWDIFGPERHITRSKENILYELDGKPALSLYKEYLGEKAEGLPATGLLFPLAIRENINDPKQLVRTILGIDEKEQALIFAGDMPTGYLAQLMRANFDRLITGAKEASELTLSSKDEMSQTKSAILLIAVSCVGRKLLLGERTEEETESVLNIFPKSTRLVGFYSYGEISPHTKGNCDLHNQTMTLTCLAEKD